MLQRANEKRKEKERGEKKSENYAILWTQSYIALWSGGEAVGFSELNLSQSRQSIQLTRVSLKTKFLPN